jgi:long-chain alkane monooxygenase
VLRTNIDDIRRRAVNDGRRPDSIRFITSFEIIVDSTDSPARAKADQLSAYYNLEGGLVLSSALSGVDWLRYGVDRPIEQFQPTPAGQSWRQLMTPTRGSASRCATTSASSVASRAGCSWVPPRRWPGN